MLCGAVNVVAQPANAGPAKYNYFIEQTAQAGPHKIQLTEQGMKVECIKMGFCAQYRESDKLVTVWSLKNRTYYTLPYDQWITKFRNLFAAVGWYAELVKPTGVSSQAKDNLNFHIYHYRIDALSPSYWSSDIGHKEKSEGLQDIDYITVDVPSTTACAIMQKIYDTPRVAGFPYRMNRTTLQASSLHTLRLVRNYAEPISFFRPSPAYKKVPFANQFIGPSFDENMTRMILPY